MKKPKLSNIVYTEKDLQGYFFSELWALNTRSFPALSESIIFYSSKVLEQYSSSQRFFNIKNGKVSDKILGELYLESYGHGKGNQKRILKDIADTAMFLCGFFSKSLNKKIVDISYYNNLGRISYKKLNTLSPTYMNIDQFYLNLAENFDQVTELISIISQSHTSKMQEISDKSFLCISGGVKNDPESNN